jgi:hypothetical protein
MEWFFGPFNKERAVLKVVAISASFLVFFGLLSNIACGTSSD